jgi:glyoxylase-like metal-dependent hydrolase (beta-lactamase superfamily II)
VIQPYKVTALRFGLLQRVDYSQIVYLRRIGERMDFPVWGALLQGLGKNILVDLGIYNPEWASKNIIACVREEFDDPAVALRQAAGLAPEDIDFIVFTHLHWDHIGEDLRPFTKARIVVQQKEWDYMFHPVSFQQWAYRSSLEVCQHPDLDPFRWYFVDGWVEFLPGLRLMPTPGHTPGHQTVLVKTSEGRLMIAGDAVNMVENLELDLPSAVATHGELYNESMALIRRSCDFLLGGHELAVKPFQTSGFPLVSRRS